MDMMKVGASYYPETLPRSEWERDLATGREIGLSCLRCGEFAWAALCPDEGAWTPEWALDFLDLAHRYGYEVIWCTPSAAPPPYVLRKWPDLQAVNVRGDRMPVGVRRNYCPNYAGYWDLCAGMARRLADLLHDVPAVVGWQVDNELAGGGSTCWCERCRRAFQDWLRGRYGSLDALNDAWQSMIWSQVYTAWEEIPIPTSAFPAHAPSLKVDFRRFRSDNWLDFYRRQADAFRQGQARPVSTNFYNFHWDVTFDHWQWRPHLDAIGISHYLEDETASRFQLAVLSGPSPGEKPLWVLEQKAGQQSAQNLYPEDLKRLRTHLQICAEFGAEYAIYWHLRQHAAGFESEHGAVLRHDGQPTRIARAIAEAVRAVRTVSPVVPVGDKLLVFSFQQHWANEGRPQSGTRWDYRTEVESWYGAARDTFGQILVGDWRDVGASHRLVIAPFLQLAEPGMWAHLRDWVESGGTLVTTADLGRLDNQNNVLRQPPLGFLQDLPGWPRLEVFHLREGCEIEGHFGEVEASGRIFWAVPEEPVTVETYGSVEDRSGRGPLALGFPLGQGRLVAALTVLGRSGTAALLQQVLA
jgi:beta-galactosidase